MTDRFEKLRSQYPDVAQSALMNMPAGFEGDAVKVHSFAEAWETAEALSGMIKKHVLGMGRPESSAFAQIAGPTVNELANSHSERFLNNIRGMAWDKGGIGKTEVAAAFMEQVEKVMTLQKDIKVAAQEEAQSRRLSR